MGRKRSKRGRQSNGEAAQGASGGGAAPAAAEGGEAADGQEGPAAKRRGVVSSEKILQWRPTSVAGAVRYLTLWNEGSEEWKFRKVRQTFLLQHMYDPLTLDKEMFKIMQRYLQDMRGRARSDAQSRAEKLLASAETASEEGNRSNEARHLLLLTHARRLGKQVVANMSPEELAEAQTFADKAMPVLRHRAKRVARILAQPPASAGAPAAGDSGK